MNLGATRSRLAAVTQELSLKWRETKNYWKDARSLEFEHRYIEELAIRVDKAVTVIEKLDVLLTKVKKDCE
jgi:hypothetical protein